MQWTIDDTTIEILQCDITTLKVDAIVNAANSSLMGGGGVDGAIHRAGGSLILEQCKIIIAKIGRLKTGEAVITGAGKLQAKFVIHTVGPIWHGGKNLESELLANCYKNSLELGKKHQIQSIAFPSISTGVYGYPIDQACKIAISTAIDFVKKNQSSYHKIIFSVFSDRDFEIYNKAIINFLS